MKLLPIAAYDQLMSEHLATRDYALEDGTIYAPEQLPEIHDEGDDE